jgi:hypothetical protein
MMRKLYALLGLVAAIASVTAMLSTSATTAFAINNAQDDKNNPTFPGCGVGTGTCQSDQAQSNNAQNCDKHDFGIVGNGRNLPAQCY